MLKLNSVSVSAFDASDVKDNQTVKLNAFDGVTTISRKDIIATGNIKVNKHGEFIALGDEIVISSDYKHFVLKGKNQKTNSKIFDKNNGKENKKKDKKGLLF